MVRLLYRDTDQLKVQQLVFWAILGLVLHKGRLAVGKGLSSLPLRDKDVSHSTRHSQGSQELQAVCCPGLQPQEGKLRGGSGPAKPLLEQGAVQFL